MKYSLRPYQGEAKEATLHGFGEHQTQLLVLPTGGGKTIVFSSIIEHYVSQGKRCLILAHREELLHQAQDKLHKSMGILSGLERASDRASLGAPVVVGSVQTLCREKRLHRWPKNHFDLVIIDEAHRALSETYARVIDWFVGEGKARLLGVTATPDRTDKRNLGSVFESVSYEISLKRLIQEGFLCPIRVKSFPIEMDLARVRTVGGDYDTSELGRAMEPLLYPMAKAYAENIGERKRGLVFMPLRTLARDFGAILEEEFGVPTGYIDGETRDRAQVLQDFRDGAFHTLCNAMLLTEGYDEPSIDLIMCGRPTKSRSLYAQVIGRGTRLFEGKRDLLVLDPLWLSEDHLLVKPAHLVAETKEDAEAITEELKDPDYLPGIDPEDYDLIEASETALESRMKTIEKRLKEKAKVAAKSFDPITYALKVMESTSLAEYRPSMPWESAPPSAKQIEVLEKEGFPRESILCKGHASKLIDEVFTRRQAGLATTKQLFHLHKMKIPNANGLSMSEASAALSAKWGRGKNAPVYKASAKTNKKTNSGVFELF